MTDTTIQLGEPPDDLKDYVQKIEAPNPATSFAPIRNTESLLDRAAQIDPEAWASPMPARMQARRNRSYAQAAKEFKDDER